MSTRSLALLTFLVCGAQAESLNLKGNLSVARCDYVDDIGSVSCVGASAEVQNLSFDMKRDPGSEVAQGQLVLEKEIGGRLFKTTLTAWKFDFEKKPYSLNMVIESSPIDKKSSASIGATYVDLGTSSFSDPESFPDLHLNAPDIPFEGGFFWPQLLLTDSKSGTPRQVERDFHEYKSGYSQFH